MNIVIRERRCRDSWAALTPAERKYTLGELPGLVVWWDFAARLNHVLKLCHDTRLMPAVLVVGNRCSLTSNPSASRLLAVPKLRLGNCRAGVNLGRRLSKVLVIQEVAKKVLGIGRPCSWCRKYAF